MKRNELKRLIKECVKEILLENQDSITTPEGPYIPVRTSKDLQNGRVSLVNPDSSDSEWIVTKINKSKKGGDDSLTTKILAIIRDRNNQRWAVDNFYMAYPLSAIQNMVKYKIQLPPNTNPILGKPWVKETDIDI